MPVDFTMLMSASPPGMHGYDRLPTFDPDLAVRSSFACRRYSSFPPGSTRRSSNSDFTPLQSVPKSISEVTLVMSEPIVVPQPTPTVEFLNCSASAPSAFTLGDLESALAVAAEEEAAPAPVCVVVKAKKRVVFADDAGRALCEVRHMTESSDVPPKLDSSVLRALLGEAACEEARPCATWFLGFSQPASEYLKFRQTLEAQNVALENVILKNEECTLVGTVKVRNICFHKSVFLRLTDDGWATHKDFPCEFSPLPGTSREAAAFDTFAFRVQIPCDDERRRSLEFCLCFTAEDGTEYWDSAGGKNFVLQSQKAGLQRASTSVPRTARVHAADATKLGYSNWGSFSAWQDLDDACPYY